MQNKNTENTIVSASHTAQEIWNKKDHQQTSRNRRSLKNTHSKKLNGDMTSFDARNRIGIPPGFARKRNSFNIFQESVSVSKSKSKHRHYFKAERSENKKDKSKSRYDQLGESTEIYYKSTTRKGESVELETIMKNIKERALKKFEENRNTIDIGSLELNHRLSHDKDSIVRNLFASKTQTI